MLRLIAASIDMVAYDLFSSSEEVTVHFLVMRSFRRHQMVKLPFYNKEIGGGNPVLASFLWKA